MLGKLFKHEFYQMSKKLSPVYLGIILFTIVGRFFSFLSTRRIIVEKANHTFVSVINFLSGFFITIYFIIILGLLAYTIVILVTRFYKNYFTDEGYLMMSLPVKTSALINSKLFNAFIWSIFSILLVVLGGLILFSTYDSLKTSASETLKVLSDLYSNSKETLERQLGVPVWAGILELIVLVAISTINFFLVFYAAVVSAQHSKIRSKAVATVIYYFIITTVFFFIFIVQTLFFGSLQSYPEFLNKLGSGNTLAIQMTLIGIMIEELIFTIILYTTTLKSMKTKLNLP
ncbi:MAG: hypothetical protein Q4E28_02525 [Clostridia bacterium]|nr:hypothetical protein [Clostridia bacterium]